MAIPWATILANAPALAASARTLLSKTRAGRDRATELSALADRVQALEQRNREIAELVAELAAQNAALTTATEVLEARGRWLLLVAGFSAVLALAMAALAIVLMVYA